MEKIYASEDMGSFYRIVDGVLQYSPMSVLNNYIISDDDFYEVDLDAVKAEGNYEEVSHIQFILEENK